MLLAYQTILDLYLISSLRLTADTWLTRMNPYDEMAYFLMQKKSIQTIGSNAQNIFYLCFQ